jgi:hypothetical protein
MDFLGKRFPCNVVLPNITLLEKISAGMAEKALGGKF